MNLRSPSDNTIDPCHSTHRLFAIIFRLFCIMNAWTFVGCILLTVIPATEGLQFTIKPTDQSANVGSNISMRDYTEIEAMKEGGAVVGFSISGVRKRNNGPYTCKGARTLPSRELLRVSATATLTVRVAPTTPTISADKIVYREGQSITLTCSSSGGNPMPRLIWSRQRQVGSAGTLPPGTTPVQDKLFGVTKSQLTFTATANDDQAIIHCAAVNEVAKANSSATLLKVQYKPHIERFLYNPYRFVKGDMVEVPCKARGNPQPVVSWRGTSDGIRTFSTSASTLVLHDVRRTNSGNYTCTATNAEATVTSTLTLEIHYAPTILLQRSYDVREYDNLDVVCRVEAFPKATVSWRKEGLPLRAWDGRTLSITRIPRTEAGRYTCIATNTLRPSGKSVQSKRSENSTDIVVKYPPKQPKVEVSPGRTVIVGNPVTLSCTAHAEDPGVPAPSFEWTNAQNGAVVSSSSDYEIAHVTLADNTVYQCVAKNSQGQAAPVAITLTVDEPPRFLEPMIPPALTVRMDQSDALQQSCIARGKPAPSVSWLRNNEVITDSSELFSIQRTSRNVDTFSFRVEAVLQWRGKQRSRDGIGLSPDDNAEYKCVARNNKNTDRRTVKLNVMYKPQFTGTQPKVATSPGSTGKLVCIISALPKLSTQEWRFADGPPLASIGRYQIQQESDDARRIQKSTLSITGVRESDLGRYQCIAKNTQGAGTTVISLQRESVPERPEPVRIAGDTWESMLLDWRQPFDGGFPQTLELMVEWNNKRSLKRLQPTIERYNLTGLLPRTNYSVQLRGSNKLGSGPFSNAVRHLTANLYIPRIEMIKLNSRTRTLSFVGPVGYCVRIEISQDDGHRWSQYRDCLKPEAESLRLTDSVVADSFRGYLCLQQRPEVCSEPMVAEIVDNIPDIPTKTIIVVACVCAVVILVLLIVLLYFCCKRRKPRKSDYEANPAHRRPQAMTVQFPADQPANDSSNSLTSGKPYAMVPPSGHHDASPAYADRYDSAKPPVFATSQSSKDPLLASFADSGSDPPSPRRLVSSFSSNTVGRPPSTEALRLMANSASVHGTLQGHVDNHSMDMPMTPLTADGRTLSPTPNGDSATMKPKKVIYEVVV